VEINTSQDVFRSLIQSAHLQGEYQCLVNAIPYANSLGVKLNVFGDEVVFELPAQTQNLGNPLLPALHGGAIGGFMEVSASVHLMMQQKLLALPKIIDISIDYLRAGRLHALFADCEVIRQGSRVANVYIRAWQHRREDPIATARAHFLIVD
jgi:uncharacterized protein (TIGR00369 family)